MSRPLTAAAAENCSCFLRARLRLTLCGSGLLADADLAGLNDHETGGEFVRLLPDNLQEKAERDHDLSSRLEEDSFVGQGIGGIRQRRLDVSVLQARVGLDQVRFRCVLAQLAQDQLNGYPRSANDRLAQHDVRIDLDALVFHANRRRRSIISHKPQKP